MNELKPCPFCMGEAELCYMPALWGYALYVSCKGCDAKSPRNWQEKEPKLGDTEWKVAADQWNHRPGEAVETCGKAYCEHNPEGLPVCSECREASTLAHDIACAKLTEARAEIERLKLVSQNQETVIAAQRRSAKAKNELIEQMREALELMLEGAMHDFHYACQHRDNCLCWGCQKARIKAALAAERGE